MSVRHRVLGVVRVCLGPALLALLIAGVVDQVASANDAPSPADSPPETAEPQSPPDFFKLYPADEGALTYEQLIPEEKAAVDKAAAWATSKHGPAVHQAWSTASRQAAARARVRKAELESGLSNPGDLGVPQ